STNRLAWPLALVAGLALIGPAGPAAALGSAGSGFHAGPAFSAPIVGANRSAGSGAIAPPLGAARSSSAPPLRPGPFTPGGFVHDGRDGRGFMRPGLEARGRMSAGRLWNRAGSSLAPTRPAAAAGQPRPDMPVSERPSPPATRSGTAPSASRSASRRVDTIDTPLGLESIPSLPTQMTNTTPPSAIGQPGVDTQSLPPLSTRLESSVSTATQGGSSPNLMPGGGGSTLADCMALWDPTTHMSKVEWRQTCQRTAYG